MTQNVYVEENLNLPKDVRQVPYKFFVLFSGDKTLVFQGTGVGLAFNVSEKDAKDIIDKYLVRNLIEPLYNENNFMIFGKDDNTELHDLMRIVSLLFFFREYVKSDREYRKYAETVLELNSIQLLFWYSRAIEYSKKGEEYAKKVVKAFKELYL